eukprot:TRINITY_DN7590_c0_g1_i2.p1 TRINITY_DN7590_c0_g1~~TRINITY_DN7590_c0_g1_i2.p1  ORF type:complete len:410 (-),score=57.88 TRINITY_DN7590_c0_g1_i2:704-1894(-)
MASPSQEEPAHDLPLTALFDQAYELYSNSISTGIGSDEVSRGCRLLQRCQELVYRLALFSANEEKEDISTADLKYLLIPFYLADLTEKLPSNNRPQMIHIITDYLLVFLRSSERLGFLTEGQFQLLTPEVARDPETRRAQKIARFKQQKAAEAKILEIKERTERRRRSMQAAARASSAAHGEDDLQDEDEEEQREAWTIQISLALYKALDLLEMLRREDDMLAAIEASGEDLRSRAVLDDRITRAEALHKDASIKARTSRAARSISCATFAQDVIEGRASLQHGHTHTNRPLFGPASMVTGNFSTERDRIVAEVFQPSHSLPSMSIEQAGEREMAMMKKWNARNAKIAEEASSSWVDKRTGGDSDDDAAEYKARAWDDWKDEHPKGAGNKKLTPCG